MKMYLSELCCTALKVGKTVEGLPSLRPLKASLLQLSRQLSPFFLSPEKAKSPLLPFSLKLKITKKDFILALCSSLNYVPVVFKKLPNLI